jgi:hypothetical protein
MGEQTNNPKAYIGAPVLVCLSRSVLLHRSPALTRASERSVHLKYSDISSYMDVNFYVKCLTAVRFQPFEA